MFLSAPKKFKGVAGLWKCAAASYSGEIGLLANVSVASNQMVTATEKLSQKRAKILTQSKIW